MKKVFIVPGWYGHLHNGWFPWIVKKLGQEGFSVEALDMPERNKPDVDAWVQFLQRRAGVPDEETYFIGHSLGCQAILRYLETLHPGAKIGGLVFAAGFLILNAVEHTPEELEVATPWLTSPINFAKIQPMIPKCIAIFSDNDPYVSLFNKELFEKKLLAHTIVEHNKKHFTWWDGVLELQSVFDAMLEISKK